jgi:signal transduction histidine kinase
VVRNALRYTPEHSVIEIVLQRDPAAQTAQLTVRDHGPGVPAAALESIFRPFYRVADARDRKTGGVGLGLAITQRAVHWHSGEVNAENAEDGGLVVRLSLPLEAAGETPRQSGGSAQSEIRR